MAAVLAAQIERDCGCSRTADSSVQSAFLNSRDGAVAQSRTDGKGLVWGARSRAALAGSVLSSVPVATRWLSLTHAVLQ